MLYFTDQTDCSWVSDSAWYFDKRNQECAIKSPNIDCVGLVIFEQEEACLIHAAREYIPATLFGIYDHSI